MGTKVSRFADRGASNGSSAAESSRHAALTTHQIEVLRLLAQLHGTEQIAATLGISTRGVRRHVRALLCRLTTADGEAAPNRADMATVGDLAARRRAAVRARAEQLCTAAQLRIAQSQGLVSESRTLLARLEHPRGGNARRVTA